MPTELDLEVLPFKAYDLVVDARTPGEFANDHIPGSLNLPTLSEEEYEKVGEMIRSERSMANVEGVSAGLRRVGEHLRTRPEILKAESVLVYCARGGRRSGIWADALRALDKDVTILPGGWRSYRRWVVAGIEQLSRSFEYRVLAGRSGCGQEEIADAMKAYGAQVLDLGAIGRRSGRPMSSLDERTQPRQALFESELLEALRGLDNTEAVWVVYWGDVVGKLKIPGALREAISLGRVVEVGASMEDRVARLLRIHKVTPARFESMVGRLIKLSTADERSRWTALARTGQLEAAVETVVVEYVDQIYQAQRQTLEQLDEAVVVDLAELTSNAIRRTARMLLADMPRAPIPGGTQGVRRLPA